MYVSGVDCQWIDVTDVRPGNYVLVIEVNPNRLVKESNFVNNRVECDLFLQVTVIKEICHTDFQILEEQR